MDSNDKLLTEKVRTADEMLTEIECKRRIEKERTKTLGNDIMLHILKSFNEDIHSELLINWMIKNEVESVELVSISTFRIHEYMSNVLPDECEDLPVKIIHKSMCNLGKQTYRITKGRFANWELTSPSSFNLSWLHWGNCIELQRTNKTFSLKDLFC